MLGNCSKDESCLESMSSFIELVSELIKLLIDRNTKDSLINRLAGNINFLNFYSKSCQRDDLYVKYIKELVELHTKVGNCFTEAGFTILKVGLSCGVCYLLNYYCLSLKF